MGYVTATQIANFLNATIIGDDFEVTGLSSLSAPKNHSVCFSKKDINRQKIMPEKQLILAPLTQKSTAITATVILVENPRLSFAKVVSHFFVSPPKAGIHPSAVIGDKVKIHSSVSIGANCVVGDFVEIGEGSRLNNSITIAPKVKIGKECYIKSGAVIGEDGFGFDFEQDKQPFRLPHLGSVIIGDNVEIGANATIACGTIDHTIIEDFVKIDDQVHIAHNCVIGEKSIITACAELSGSVHIGKKTWIGPNASIIQKVHAEDESMVGIGAVVTKNVNEGQTVMGISAMGLKELIRFRK